MNSIYSVLVCGVRMIINNGYVQVGPCTLKLVCSSNGSYFLLLCVMLLMLYFFYLLLKWSLLVCTRLMSTTRHYCTHPLFCNWNPKTELNLYYWTSIFWSTLNKHWLFSLKSYCSTALFALWKVIAVLFVKRGNCTLNKEKGLIDYVIFYGSFQLYNLLLKHIGLNYCLRCQWTIAQHNSIACVFLILTSCIFATSFKIVTISFISGYQIMETFSLNTSMIMKFSIYSCILGWYLYSINFLLILTLRSFPFGFVRWDNKWSILLKKQWSLPSIAELKKLSDLRILQTSQMDKKKPAHIHMVIFAWFERNLFICIIILTQMLDICHEQLLVSSICIELSMYIKIRNTVYLIRKANGVWLLNNIWLNK